MSYKVLSFLNTKIQDIFNGSIDGNGIIKESIVPKLTNKEFHKLETLINVNNFIGNVEIGSCKLYFEVLLFECQIEYQNHLEIIKIETTENSYSIVKDHVKFDDIKLPTIYRILVYLLLDYFRSFFY